MLKKLLFSEEITFEDFRQNYQYKKCCILRKGAKEFKQFFSRNDVNDLLARAGFYHHEDYRFRFVQSGGEVDMDELLTEPSPGLRLKPHKVREFFLKGGSVQIQWAEDISSKLNELSLEFQHLLESRCGNTVFYSANGSSRSSKEHYDHLDVYVIQTSGRKRWQVRERIGHSTKYSMDNYTSDKVSQNVVQAEEDKGKIILDIVLEEGDVFYIPRGFPHIVSPMGEESIHIAIGNRPICLQDVINWKRERKMFSEKLLLDIDFNDVSSHLESLNNEHYNLTEGDLEEFKKDFVSQKFRRMESNYIPKMSVSEIADLNRNFKIIYLPDYKMYFEAKDGLTILNVNSDSFELEDHLVQSFIDIMDEIYSNKKVDFFHVLQKHENLGRDTIIVVLDGLYTNGIIDIQTI